VVRPGGGKTASALTAIAELQESGEIRHALVVAPKRVATEVWPAEIGAWEHLFSMHELRLAGTPHHRTEFLRRLRIGEGPYTISVIGLDLIAWLLEQIADWPEDHPVFDLLVLDEISKLRDPTGVRAKLLAKHAHRWKMIWGLSGTLRPNSALDLFMPARIVTRGKLWGKSYYQWRKERFYQTDYMGYSWTALPGAEGRINAEIEPYCVTLHADELPQLPELSVVLDTIHLPDAVKDLYHQMHRKLFAQIRKGKDEIETVIAANAAVATGKLAQIANGFMYPNEEETAAGRRVTPLHDEKRDWLADLVREHAGRPTLLVYEYLEDLNIMCEVAGRELPYLGAGVGDKVSAAHIRRWNAGEYPLMALHPRAAGHGLNLQAGGADMAWMAPTWSPELWEQTIARLHRSGQTQPVIVRVCVAAGTVDQLKLNRVHFKMTEQQAFERYLAGYEEVGLDG